MDKESQKLLERFANRRITIVNPNKNERKQIRAMLRGDGFLDVIELDTFEEAWEKLKLATTSVLIFSVEKQEGLDFLGDLIESARFVKTPLIPFTSKFKEHPKLFAHAEGIIEWGEAPMTALSVESALLRVFHKGLAEKSQVADESAALRHFTQAIEAMASEAWSVAKGLLRSALKESPTFFEAYLKMGETLTNLGEYEPAERVLARASQLRPDHPKVTLAQLKLTALTKPKDEAIRQMDYAVGRRPHDAMFIIEVGNIALERGWIDDAVRYFEMAKGVDPDLIHVYNRLGIAYSRQKNFDRALSMYHLALEIDPNDAGIHFNIGMTYYRMGDSVKAKENFLKSSELDPELAEPREMIEKLGGV